MDQTLARITKLYQEGVTLRQSRPAEAAARFQAAFDILRSESALKLRFFGELAPRLGAMYLELAEYTRARQVLIEGLEYLHELGIDPAGADALNLQNSLAVVRLMERDFAGARDEFLAVLDARRRAVPADLDEIARTLNNLSRACAELGLDVEAQHAVEEAYDIMRVRAKEGDSVLTAALHNLAVAHMEAGHLEAALHGFQRARRSAETEHAANTPDFASILHEIARLYGEMYRFEEANAAAKACYVLRYNVLGDRHPELGRAFHTAGRLLRDGGDHAQALLAFRSAYQTFTALYGIGHPDTLRAVFDMMTAARKSQASDDVERDLRDLIPVARAAGAADNPFLFRGLTDLAALHDAKGKEAKARHTASDAVAVFRTLQSAHDDALAPYYVDLARLRERQRAPLDALALLDRAVHVDDALIGRLLTSRDFILRRAYTKRLARGTADVVRLVVEQLPQDETAAASAFSLVVTRKGLLAHAFLARRDADLAARQPELARLLAQVAQLEAEVAETQMAGPVDGWNKLLTAVDRLTNRIREINAEIEFETKFDNRIAPDVGVITGQVIADRLVAGSALVEFYALPARPSVSEDDEPRRSLERTGADEWLLPASMPERYVAFVLSSGFSAPRFVDLGPGADLERLVYSWLITIGNHADNLVPRNRQEDLIEGAEPDLSRQLRAKLFDPLRSMLGTATTIRVAPDGVVCRVPFAALLEDGDPQARFVERFTFTSVSSGRSILRFGEKVDDSRAPFVLGDPDYDLAKPGAPAPPAPAIAAADFYFERLTGTADEAWRVSRMTGGQMVTSRRAHEAAVCAVRSPAILHLATHGYYVRPFSDGIMVIGNWREMKGGDWGFFARRQVLGYAANPFSRSGLVLAGANAWTRGQPVPADVGDGLLTAFEVAQLDLHATELVVLSACSTALGDVAPGTAVAGLVQALHLAGARTTVAAMWSIPDETTVSVMDTFYHEVLAGTAREEALRHAQLTLMRNGNPPWRWAAYVCYGDPTPMLFRPPAANGQP